LRKISSKFPFESFGGGVGQGTKRKVVALGPMEHIFQKERQKEFDIVISLFFYLNFISFNVSWSPLLSSASYSFVSNVISTFAGVEDDPSRVSPSSKVLDSNTGSLISKLANSNSTLLSKPISSGNTSHIFVFPFNHSSLYL